MQRKSFLLIYLFFVVINAWNHDEDLIDVVSRANREHRTAGNKPRAMRPKGIETTGNGLYKDTDYVAPATVPDYEQQQHSSLPQTPFCDSVPWSGEQASFDDDLVCSSIPEETTLISVGFYIESMSTFRSQSMDFEVDMYFAVSWFDERLKHNCSHPILITDVEVAATVWQPDLYFVNSKFGFIHQVTTPNFMILVYNDGFVFKSSRINVILACLLKLRYFPMDQQECGVMIQSFAYVQNVVNLTWHEDAINGFPVNYNPNLKSGLSDMFLVGSLWDRCDFPYPMFRGTGNWSCLKGTIIMLRKLQYHIIQVFVPTAMLVIISWLSFWLDIRASPARISLTITTLLTLTTMSNGSRADLPQVSYMKSIDKWVATCQAFVFSVLIEYTIVCFFAGYKTSKCTRHPREHSIKNDGGPHKAPSLVTGECRRICAICSYQWERNAKRVDRVSRFLFPICFLLFNFIYWCSHYDQLQNYLKVEV